MRTLAVWGFVAAGDTEAAHGPHCGGLSRHWWSFHVGSASMARGHPQRLREPPLFQPRLCEVHFPVTST